MKAKWKDKVIAESDDTIYLEGNYYFPPDGVSTELLRDGSTQYTCPWKGKANYHDVAIDGEVNENSAWSYPDPKPAAKEISGYVAFDRAKGIKVEP